MSEASGAWGPGEHRSAHHTRVNRCGRSCFTNAVLCCTVLCFVQVAISNSDDVRAAVSCFLLEYPEAQTLTRAAKCRVLNVA